LAYLMGVETLYKILWLETDPCVGMSAQIP
jgi:hypothetical protein